MMTPIQNSTIVPYSIIFDAVRESTLFAQKVVIAIEELFRGIETGAIRIVVLESDEIVELAPLRSRWQKFKDGVVSTIQKHPLLTPILVGAAVGCATAAYRYSRGDFSLEAWGLSNGIKIIRGSPPKIAEEVCPWTLKEIISHLSGHLNS